MTVLMLEFKKKLWQPPHGACPDGEWPNALPLTASWLPLLPGFESRPGPVRKLPVTRVWAVVLAGLLWCPPPITTG